MFDEVFSGILDAAKEFSTQATPAMARRDVLVARVRDLFRDQLQTTLGVGDDGLRVAGGGRQSQYSPVPWVRVYDPKHSPNAMTGFYVVYLFAADGSAVYASLNQGTSEWRANKWRPIRDQEALSARAALGRTLLRHWDTRVLRAGATTLDLRADSADVGYESKMRIRNYEHANVAAYRYARGALPDEERVLDDLAELLALLWDLQDAEAGHLDASRLQLNSTEGERTDDVRRRAARQGRRVDPAANRACEMHAVESAIAYFTAQGWAVTHVGHQRQPYDLRCLRGNDELRVEVKGTTTLGSEITLTPNEVDHARAYGRMALYVLSEIELDEATNDARGGRASIIDEWQIDDDSLKPASYVYRLR